MDARLTSWRMEEASWNISGHAKHFCVATLIAGARIESPRVPSVEGVVLRDARSASRRAKKKRCVTGGPSREWKRLMGRITRIDRRERTSSVN